MGGRSSVDGIYAVGSLVFQKLAGIIAGIFIGIGAVGMEHCLHVSIVPAFDKTAGIFRIVFYGDNASSFYHDGDIFFPSVAEIGGLGRIITILEARLISAAC